MMSLSANLKRKAAVSKTRETEKKIERVRENRESGWSEAVVKYIEHDSAADGLDKVDIVGCPLRQ